MVSTLTRVSIDRGLELKTIFNEDMMTIHKDYRFLEAVPSNAMTLKELYVKGHRNIGLRVLDISIDSPFVKVYNESIGEFSLRLSRKLQGQIVRENKTNINLVIERSDSHLQYFDTSKSTTF